MRDRFNEFQDKAMSANLGERNLLRQEGQASVGMKRMGTGWLANLADLQAEEEESER